MRRRCPRMAVFGVCALLLVTAVGLLGCGQPSSPSRSFSPVPPTSSALDITSTASLPAGEPQEIHRFGEDKKLWQAWISGDYVVWMESAGPVSGSGLGYSGSPDWDTVFGYVPIGGGDVTEVPGLRLLAPQQPSSGPYGFTLPLSWATVLSQGPGKPFKLVLAAPPEKLGETYFFRGLFSWSPGGDQADLLPQSALSFHAQVSGDAIAIPVPAASYTSTAGDENDPRNWEKLLMMTGNMSAPVEVDPRAPKLPASALSGLSPYFGLLTVEPSGRGIVSIYDLRTGKKLALELPAPPQPSPAIVGNFATWYTENGDVYLADLESGKVQKVLSLETATYDLPSVALGEQWLVVLKVSPSPGPISSTTQPSEHPGADLIALHLPDLRRVEIPAVVAKGEVGGVQVSGNVVLLSVSPAILPMPHNQPPWVALRVLRLE